MWLSKNVTWVCLLGLFLLGCYDRPHFTLKLSGISDKAETLYVNAALLDPKAINGTEEKELTFDLKPYRAKGEFDFGVTLELKEKITDGIPKAFIDMAFVDGQKCVLAIHRVYVEGPGGWGAPTAVERNIGAPRPEHSEEVIPMYVGKGNANTSPCFRFKRPLVTAVHRQIAGRFGDPKSNVIVYGWGLYQGTSVDAKFCTAPGSCGQRTLPYVGAASPSTTQMSFDATPMADLVQPVISLVATLVAPAFASSYPLVGDYLRNIKAQTMSPALFPFIYTVKTPDGTDTWDEYYNLQ